MSLRNCQFGSATPAQYRNAVCQVLAFSRFDASPAGNLTAHFTIAPLEIQTVHLDSDVLFGNLMLSVRIQGKDDDEEADTDAPVLASSPTGSTSSSSSSRSTFPFTLSLVEGLDRVYRSWFVDPQSPLPTYAGMTMRTAPQVLYPSAVCALLKANIQCLLTPKPAPSATPLFRSELDEEPPIDLHFYYESVELDVGRLVASAEKGLSSGFPRGEMTLYVRRT